MGRLTGQNLHDRVHFIDYNTTEAQRVAAENADGIAADKIVVALDTRDDLCKKIGQKIHPEIDWDKHNKRLADAQMIPTMWAMMPRNGVKEILIALGLKSAESLDLETGDSHFWFVAFTDNTAVIQLTPKR